MAQKDLKPSLQRDFPKTRPEKAIGEYIASKMEAKTIKKFPEWDVPGPSPTIKCANYAKKLLKVEELLAEKRAEAKKRREQTDAQWRDLEQKEELFKQSFVRFNKFVKENEEKRERAEKKTVEETQRLNKKEEDIEELRRNYDEMMEIKKKMESEIGKHKSYENYLETVVAASPEFKDVDDILSRYEALIAARRQLIERQERDLTALENAHADMIAVVENKSFEIMGLQNHLAHLQGRYDRAKNKVLHWETVVARIRDYAAAKTEEIHRARTTCWDVYRQMCRRKKVEPQFQERDVENQLLFVKSTLLELARIARLAKRRTNREAASEKAERGVSK